MVMVKQKATAVYIWFQLCVFTLTTSSENVMGEALFSHVIRFSSYLTV